MYSKSISKRHKLSIIIVNYNTAKITLDCLKSIIKNSPNFSYEVIVIDNASNDDSVKRLRDFVKKHSNFSLIENDTNLGFARANNQGIESSLGQYILLLNSDTLVKNDSLKKLVVFAQAKRGAAAVVPKLLNKDGTVQASVFKLPTISRAIGQYWLRMGDYTQKYVPKGKTESKVEAAVMAAFLITPFGMKKVGLLNEKYFMYFEDLDYCRKILRKGLKIYYYPSAEIVHLHGASGKNVADSKDQWRRLIPSSKIYHGRLKHYIYNFILWSGQKIQKFKS